MSSLLQEDIRTGLGYSWPDWVDVTTPAAGAAASYTVTGECWVRVVAARASLTTDANAANRFVSLDYINARGVTYCRNAGGVVIPASQSGQQFEWARNRTVAEWATNTPFLLPLLDQWMPPGFVVKFAVDAIQATDALSGLRLWVEKWNTGPNQGGLHTFDTMPPR